MQSPFSEALAADASPPTAPARLSFTKLAQRIDALPDGPISVLDTPAWARRLNVVGTSALIAGLLPVVLIRIFEPQQWMVPLAQGGTAVACVALLPYICRSWFVVARSMLMWKPEQVGQLDHDIEQFRLLDQWLSGFPREQIVQHLRFARAMRARLTEKVGLLGGSLDKLGIIPVVVALGLQLKAVTGDTQLPLWQGVLALLLAITYVIAFMGALMRSRLQLYEMVLAEAVEDKPLATQELEEKRIP
ncbi:MAG: hypothetical protein M3Q42_13520 [Pseudomonadota bacterium]|nr:hypothetical protein [Pseudomonadota bacterium]